MNEDDKMYFPLNMGDFSAYHVGFHGCNHPGDRDSSRITESKYLFGNLNQILEGRLVEGPYQPIRRDSAMYVSITVSTPYPLL